MRLQLCIDTLIQRTPPSRISDVARRDVRWLETIGPRSIALFWPSADHFRSSPGNGHRQADPARPKSATSSRKMMLLATSTDGRFVRFRAEEMFYRAQAVNSWNTFAGLDA